MWNFIIRFLKKIFKYKIEIESIEEKIQIKPEVIQTKKNYFKVALIVGHTKNSSGAISYNRYTEWSYNKKIVEIVKFLIDKENLPIKIEHFFRGEEPYKKAMKKIAQNVFDWNADFSLELHFNSIGHEQNAYGCEILLNHDANNFYKSLKIADYWTDRLANRYGLKERGRYRYKDGTFGDGVKVLNIDERGYWNMAYLNDYDIPVSLLIEPTFAGTRTHESEQFFEYGKYIEYAVFLKDRIKELYKTL